MALTKISTGGVKDSAIASEKIADGNVRQSDLDGECVNESKIQISNAGSNGQFLQKQSGNAGGLTWATASTDTSDKASLSGATFTGNVILGDNIQLRFGVNQGSHDLLIYHDGSKSVLNEVGTGPLVLASNQVEIKDVNAAETMATFTEDGGVSLYHDDAAKLATSSTGITVTGTVSDSKGDVRQVPQKVPGTNAYTLIASDAGKFILAQSNITVPDAVFSTGDAITIANHTGSNITITKCNTMYNAADGTNANRTLASRGMCTIYMSQSNIAYISGSGLS